MYIYICIYICLYMYIKEDIFKHKCVYKYVYLDVYLFIFMCSFNDGNGDNTVEKVCILRRTYLSINVYINTKCGFFQCTGFFRCTYTQNHVNDANTVITWSLYLHHLRDFECVYIEKNRTWYVYLDVNLFISMGSFNDGNGDNTAEMVMYIEEDNYKHKCVYKYVYLDVYLCMYTYICIWRIYIYVWMCI
jgi:hypothetical protein